MLAAEKIVATIATVTAIVVVTLMTQMTPVSLNEPETNPEVGRQAHDLSPNLARTPLQGTVRALKKGKHETTIRESR